jgi:hypothetical protein
MRMLGRKRCLKFRVGANGSAAYEALIDNPLCKVINQVTYNSFEEFFIVVWFEDMNMEPFDPGKFMSNRKSGNKTEEEDAAEISGEQNPSSEA